MKATKEEQNPTPQEEGAENPEVKKSESGGKKKIIIIAGAAMLLIAIGAGLFFSGIFAKKPADAVDPASADASADKKAVDNTEQKPVFFNLDEFIVNLSKVGGEPSFLKMAITLELPNEPTVQQVGEQMPLIRDTFQVYLRGLRADDLQGSAGIYRLRQELLLRINKIVYPLKVNDILFREILVQ